MNGQYMDAITRQIDGHILDHGVECGLAGSVQVTSPLIVQRDGAHDAADAQQGAAFTILEVVKEMLCQT